MKCLSIPRRARQLRRIRLTTAIGIVFAATVANAAQVMIDGPAGSGNFGYSFKLLPNGNIVVLDSVFDAPGPIVDAGAAYLYRPDGTLISALYGSSANDYVGGYGVTVLSNGDYLVSSPAWHNSNGADVGAMTYASGTTGINGVVSAANSLVGSTSGDFSEHWVSPLGNGNYVVQLPKWDNALAVDAGAARFGLGGVGISGAVSAGNSLVGSKTNDSVGTHVVVLSNNNYIVGSPNWGNGSASTAGAASFGSGIAGVMGVVSASNSLVGSSAGDRVGSVGDYWGIRELGNGNYLVASGLWDNGAAVDAGAVAFGSGTSGISGFMSAANALVGASANDGVGNADLLQNGDYIVRSIYWDNALAVDAGAVTLGSGTTGVQGLVSASNSLVGGSTDDHVGGEFKELPNGNYVIGSRDWDNGVATDAGAVTLGLSGIGVTGLISAGNSLVGSAVGDAVSSYGITLLTNGNYVVRSPLWDDGAMSDVGAVTFASGSSGLVGMVSAGNSLVGGSANDNVGSGAVAALSNGNYVVPSPGWDNGPLAINAGAVTFGLGTVGVSGLVSSSNSLVGSTTDDGIGHSGANPGVVALSNGNYVVRSGSWDSGSVVDVGAATFGSGITGVTGVLSSSNSLIGNSANDQVAVYEVIALTNGNYVVGSAYWDNGLASNAGAVTFGSGSVGINGVVSPSNSLVGNTTNDYVGQIYKLENGNYVVRSSSWNNGSATTAGAITFGSGTVGVTGSVSSSNSLIGSSSGDRIGYAGSVPGLFSLRNGNYLVVSPSWNNGAITRAGAITVGSGTTATTGLVSATNSLVGSTAFDALGSDEPIWPNGVIRLQSNGYYVLTNRYWDNMGLVDAGTITLGDGTGGTVGPLSQQNSVLGTVANPYLTPSFEYDPVRNQLIVGQNTSNRVVLHRVGIATNIVSVTDTPDPSMVGQSVMFSAIVTASPNAPNNGQVTFSASSGESCVDTTATVLSVTSVQYSCAFAFTAFGSTTVVAEYTGSATYAYSRSTAVPHNLFHPSTVFSDSFEAP